MKYFIASLHAIVVMLLAVTTVEAQRNKNRPDTSAYLEQPDRIEFLFEDNDLSFTIINGAENGLLVVKETSVRNAYGYGWVLYKLDQDLKTEWTKLLIVPFDYSFNGWDHYNGQFHLLFASSPFNSEEFSIFQVDGLTAKVDEYKISTVFPINLSHFEVVDRSILLAGSVSYRPAVLTFDLDELKPRVIPGIYNGNSDLLDVYVNDAARFFTVTMLERTFEKRFTINFKSYSMDNKLLQSNVIIPGERRSVIDGAPTQFPGGVQYVAGAYSIKSPDYSRGLYLAKFESGQQSYVKYINYSELGNFFDYMGRKRRDRIEERISRRREKGKKTRFSYRLLVHDIIQLEDQFLLIAEAYYPRYSNYNLGPYASGSGNGLATISGYKYTHALVVSFDKNGKRLWDHSFAIDDVVKTQLDKTVQVVAHEDRVELHYLEENVIRSKLVINNEVIEGNSYTPVRLSSERDEFVIRDPEVEGLQHWYDDVLYAYGEQQIQHRLSERVKTKRDVFYINKVRYNTEELKK
ncbi:MAG: hypothetical protein ACI8QD_001302 [Cyclobacteriaceae bacterium]|jgi:hypothetical protein